MAKDGSLKMAKEICHNCGHVIGEGPEHCASCSYARAIAFSMASVYDINEKTFLLLPGASALECY